MARDETTHERIETDEKFERNRRSFLKGTGAAVTSAVGIGVMSSRVGASGYDTITVPAGQTKTIRVGSGQHFENKLIDQSAPGAAAMVQATGSDWTIRNVGFKGGCGAPNFGFFSIIPSVSSGSKGRIENVYMGDGAEPNSANEAESGGMWVNANTPHEGTLTVKNVNVQKYANNGLYGSGPGAAQGAGSGGPVHVEDSYFASNDISNVRLGTPDSYVKNTVIEDKGIPIHHPNGPNKRGVWGWYVPITVKDCDVRVPDYDAVYGGFHGGEVMVKNSRVKGSTAGSVKTKNVGKKPKTKIPKHVPKSAEQAAKGN